MIDQLVEKYLNAIKSPTTSGTYEIFVNPTKKEMKEVDDGGGYRYVIDHKNKKFYVFSALTFHKNMMNATPELPNFDDYWYKLKSVEYIYTGDAYKNAHGSDAMSKFGGQSLFSQKVSDKLKVLLNQDWSWLSKYLTASEIEDIKFSVEQYT